MKNKVVLFLTVVALAVCATIYGFTSTPSKSACPLAGTKDCPEYLNCPKTGQPDCPIIENCPYKGTQDCPYTNGKASCCQKAK